MARHGCISSKVCRTTVAPARRKSSWIRRIPTSCTRRFGSACASHTDSTQEGPNGGIYKTTDGGASWTKLTNGLPEGDTGKIGLAVHLRNPRIVMAIVEHGYQPQARVDGRPNPEYEDMSRLGTGIYRSDDGGASWSYVSRFNNRPFYYAHIWIDPNEDQRVYVLSGSAQISEDGGKTFARRMEGISGDFHALWAFFKAAPRAHRRAPPHTA